MTLISSCRSHKYRLSLKFDTKMSRQKYSNEAKINGSGGMSCIFTNILQSQGYSVWSSNSSDRSEHTLKNQHSCFQFSEILLKSGKKWLVPNRKFAITLRLFIVRISFNYRWKGNAEQILNI